MYNFGMVVSSFLLYFLQLLLPHVILNVIGIFRVKRYKLLKTRQAFMANFMTVNILCLTLC